MLVIRFQRVGRTNDPAFRLVVTEHQNRPQGKHLELLGSYHPKTKQKIFKADRIKHWLSHGAKPSVTAYNLLLKENIITGKPIPIKMKKQGVAAAEAPAA